MLHSNSAPPLADSNIAFCNASGWLLPDSWEVGAGLNNWNMSLPGKDDWAAWYEDGHKHFIADGLDFWWNDEGETTFNTCEWGSRGSCVGRGRNCRVTRQ